jgi:hypothetical protein
MLEVQRTSAGTENSLIIPVVLRRFDDLPASIRSHRQVYRFEQYSVSGRRIVRDRRFDADIRKMAEYIADRTREVRDHAIDCNEFRLPADEDVADLVSSMAGRPALFPGRERSE